ncbi:MAG: PHB depolymerase family esterase [Longimicrobiales bacterium]|nr:PHB depolymerase family esterase [Longimicrobiales bacterium]
MKRTLSRLYGLVAYVAFLLPIAYLVGFLADAGVPKTVDRGAGPWGPSLVVDVLLVVVFGIQHSVMARPGFKRMLHRWVPEGLERSTYVLISGLVLSAVFLLWRPIPLLLWDVSGSPLGALAWTGFGVGWILAVWATFALSHLHLFGVSQSVAYARGAEHPRPSLRGARLYRIVRHPMTAGLLLAFWSAPRMSLGHAVFAAGMTVYSLWATVLEERDLLDQFPEAYRRYRGQVPALVPFLRPGVLLPRRGGFVVELALVGVVSLVPFWSVLDLSLEPPDPGPAHPPLESGSISVGGHARSYFVFHPEGTGRSSASSGRPLVLAFHGSGGDAARFRGFLGGALEEAARERGWILAYPEALRGVWSDCRKSARVHDGAIDDLAFVRALVEHLAGTRGADPSRVYGLGYSGGGHMAFRLALEAPSLLAAVAVFAASPPRPEASRCRPVDDAVPLLMVNGTADLVSPFRGGDVIAPDGLPLGAVMASVEGARYFEGRGGGVVPVRLVTVEGGGHVVPGPASRFPAAAGRTSRMFSGVERALDFFESRGRRSGHRDGTGSDGRSTT